MNSFLTPAEDEHRPDIPYEVLFQHRDKNNCTNPQSDVIFSVAVVPSSRLECQREFFKISIYLLTSLFKIPRRAIIAKFSFQDICWAAKRESMVK